MRIDVEPLELAADVELEREDEAELEEPAVSPVVPEVRDELLEPPDVLGDPEVLEDPEVLLLPLDVVALLAGGIQTILKSMPKSGEGE